jgi:hypothetical protein
MNEFMNSGIPLENFPLVPRGHHHHHQDHLAAYSSPVHSSRYCGSSSSITGVAVLVGSILKCFDNH